MNREDIKEFFDSNASTWDERAIIDSDKINRILDYGCIRENIDVLDVGCGTGVLFDFYLKRNVKSLTAIDISQKMIDVAKAKYQNRNINIKCIDAYEFNEGEYDAIVMYDCFPHFDCQELIIKHLSNLLKKNGYLMIAHSMSIEKLVEHHKEVKDISMDPVSDEELKIIMNKYGEVVTNISNDELFVYVMKKQM